ncbi:MAG: hypothetical protein OXR84_05155 [Magnetovibrio sp.]|nr:hypothetical protein [Magnetovibrio sp.]
MVTNRPRSLTRLGLTLVVAAFGWPAPAAAAERMICLKHPTKGLLRTWPRIKEGCYDRILHGRLVYRENLFNKMAYDDSKEQRAQRRPRFNAQYPYRCSCDNSLRLVERAVKEKKKTGFAALMERFTGKKRSLYVEVRQTENPGLVYQMAWGLEFDGFVPVAKADTSLTRFRVSRPGNEDPERLKDLEHNDRVRLATVGRQGASYVNFAGDTLVVELPTGDCF